MSFPTDSTALRHPPEHPDGAVFVDAFVRSVARWPHQLTDHLDMLGRGVDRTTLIQAACMHPDAFPPHVLPEAAAFKADDTWRAFRYLTRDGQVEALRRLARVVWPSPDIMAQALAVGPERAKTGHMRTQAMAYWPELASVPGGLAWLAQISAAYEAEYPELAHALRRPLAAQARQRILMAHPARAAVAPRNRPRA